MTVTFDASGDWAVPDGPETVTYYAKVSTSTFDAGVTVTHALPGPITKLAGGAGSLAEQDATWHLWGDKLGAVVPKVGDVIQQSGGARWTVLRVEAPTLDECYRLTCLRER